MAILDMNSEVSHLRAEEERILASFTRRLIEIASVAGAGLNAQNNRQFVNAGNDDRIRNQRIEAGRHPQTVDGLLQPPAGLGVA